MRKHKGIKALVARLKKSRKSGHRKARRVKRGRKAGI
jgi:hypothetical protein